MATFLWQHRLQSRIILTAFFAVLACSAWAATPIPFVNPSFESPALTQASGWYNDVQGWDTIPEGQLGTTWDQVWNDTYPAPEGNQFVWADNDNINLAQQLGVIAADTRYVVAVDLFPLASSEPFRAELMLEETDTWSAAMGQTLLHPTWDTSREDFQLPAGEWTTVYVGFDSADWPAQVGLNMRFRIAGDRLAIDNVRGFAIANNEANAYYISESQGSDDNDGLSESSPWKTFGWIEAIELKPGEQVLLRRGDLWTEELWLRGEGSAGNEIHLADYGPSDLPRPRIRRFDIEYDRCVVVENPSHWRFHGLDMGTSKVGLYLRYWQDYENENVHVYDCYFEDMPDESADPIKHNYEHAWSTAIFIGGNVGGLPGNPNNTRTVINNISVTDCEFRNVAHGFGNAWYYPVTYKSRITNLYMADCIAWDCMNGGFAFFGVNGGLVERVRMIGGGGDVWAGTTLGFLQNCQNVTIDNCEFAFIDRAQSADGSGMDFEGDNNDCVFTNNVIHDCHGSAIINLTTQGTNDRLIIQDNTFYNNAVNSWNDEGLSEVYCGSSANSGTFENNGLYIGYNDQTHFSPNWEGTTLINNRLGNYQDVFDRPTWWSFETDGDFEGWGASNDLGSLVVSGGAITGASTGVDPYINSAPTWTPALATSYAWVRMSQTAGEFAQFFWITETDPVWDGAKSAAFAITADGTMRDYFVDLTAAGAKGVITQVRLDPTIVAGSDMAIEHVRLASEINTRQGPPTPPLPWPTNLEIEGLAEDGDILETNQTSQVGGIVNTTNHTLKAGDSSTNASYRPIVSFDTSVLPDDAYILDATLAMRRVSVVGDDPWMYGGSIFDAELCNIDMAVPSFGVTTSLEASDWQAPATLEEVGRFIVAFTNNLQVRERLTEAGAAAINKTGTTQFRLRFVDETNGDNSDDYVNFGSADTIVNGNRPIMYFSYLNAAPVLMPPAAPSEIYLENLSTDGFILWWTDNAYDEDGFRVRQNGSPSDQAANTYSKTLSGLGVNTSHEMSIAAFNGSGESSLLGPVTIWTLAETPAAPTLSNPQQTTLDVAIDSAGDNNPASTEYAIAISPAGAGGNWVQGDGTLGSTAFFQDGAGWASTTITGLTVNTTYDVTALARNGAGIETAVSAAAQETTLNQTPPAAPTLFAVTNRTDSSVTVAWQDNASDEDGYRIYYAATSDAIAADAEIHTVTSLTPNTLYELSLAAFNAGGETSAAGIVNAWTLAAQPLAPQVDTVRGRSFEVTPSSGLGANPFNTQLAIRINPATAAGEWVQSDGRLGESPHFATPLTWSTINVIGLEYETPYNVSLRARNNQLEETTDGPATQVTTLRYSAVESWESYE